MSRPSQASWRRATVGNRLVDSDWRETTVAVRGRSWEVFEKLGLAGLGERDHAAELLAADVEVDRADHVLVLSCGAGLVGAVAASLAVDGEVVLADANLVAVEAARRTMAANGAQRVRVYHSMGASQLPVGLTFDVVGVRAPKGRLPTIQLIWDAFRLLRPGGRFYLAGANDEGIQSAFERARRLFGNFALVEYRGGSRVGCAIRDRLSAAGDPEPAWRDNPTTEPREATDDFASPLLDHLTFHEFQCDVVGRSYRVFSRPGVFSWERLDAGTRALIEAMEVGARDRVLDLGCGTGIVGVVAADHARAGDVYLVDAHVDALASAERTASANGRTNCLVVASDSTSAVQEIRFDVVVTNPPFHLARHADYDLAIKFIFDAAAVLRPTGRLYVVGNRFLGYDEPLAKAFASVRIASADQHYRVFVGETPRIERAHSRQPRARSTTFG